MGMIIVVVLIVIAVILVGIYNSLVTLKVKVTEAWSDIDTQLTRRYDLIPNIVESVKGYAKHESALFEKVAALRSQAMQATTPAEKGQTENMLTETLKSLFAVAENYPQLKANENFMQLQNTLKEIEEHIQLSRRYYNGTVRDLNTKIQVFPSNLIANLFHFQAREFFEAAEEATKNVQVKF